jgi:hypothetical protein
MLPRIEQQIERFAPGFRERVLARSVMGPADLERHNANYVGGDIGAGATTLGQLFTRPTWRTYSTPVRGLYICSASTRPEWGCTACAGTSPRSARCARCCAINYNLRVNVRPVRIAALSLVIIAAVLQLSFGSRSTSFRVANAAILIVAAYVLIRVVMSGRTGQPR